MPVHDSGGAGACQRRAPTGGAAYGMPLNTVTPGAAATPRSAPDPVATSGSNARPMPAEAMATRHVKAKMLRTHSPEDDSDRITTARVYHKHRTTRSGDAEDASSNETPWLSALTRDLAASHSRDAVR